MGTDVVKNVNKNNASHAVLFEALALVCGQSIFSNVVVMDEYQMYQLALCFISAIYAQYKLWFVWMHANFSGYS